MSGFGPDHLCCVDRAAPGPVPIGSHAPLASRQVAAAAAGAPAPAAPDSVRPLVLRPGRGLQPRQPLATLGPGGSRSSLNTGDSRVAAILVLRERLGFGLGHFEAALGH